MGAGRAFDRQRKPKRRGGGLRELQGGELEELLEDEICEPELFRGTQSPHPHAQQALRQPFAQQQQQQQQQQQHGCHA